MDCSDLDRFLNNEMTKEEQEIFREHTEQCKVCKIQTEFYNSLKIGQKSSGNNSRICSSRSDW